MKKFTVCGNTHLIITCQAYGKIYNKCEQLNNFENVCKFKIDFDPKSKKKKILNKI